MRDVFDRYGPTLAMVVAIVLLVVLLPSNTHGSKSATNVNASQQLAGGTAGAGGAAANSAIATEAAAAAANGGAAASAAPGSLAANPVKTVQGQAGKFPCRSDGRQAGISRYVPPCMQFDGNNGGATAKGVTPTAVKVAYYVPQPNPATQAALKAAGAGDSQADIDRIVDVLRRYFNDHYQTYGREVQFTKVDASGAGQDDVAMKADAHKIADAGYFMAFTAGGTTTSPTFDSTLAQLGVICVACSVTQANSFYQRTSGYIFGALPSAREYYEAIGEYWGKRLAGKNASLAGPNPEGTPDPNPTSLRNQKRKFGFIWLSSYMGTVDPGAQEERDYFVNTILPKWGIDSKNVVDASYNYDLTVGAAAAQSIISKMHSAGVTTIAMLADPLTPVYFTREATNEGYFPEWFETGTGLTDTTFFGRTYDTQQWRHSFGMSPLWVFFSDETVSDGWREYHHVCDQAGASCAGGGGQGDGAGVGINVYQNSIMEVFAGIHMAGPHLTAQSFAQGQFNYPITGGTPAYPLWHITKESPNWIKDFVETWWNPNMSGKDEVNQTNVGVLMKANNGKRYLPGQWPTADPFAFGADPGPVFTTDAPYTGPGVPQHEQDGHHHPPAEKCLSCGGPWPS